MKNGARHASPHTKQTQLSVNVFIISYKQCPSMNDSLEMKGKITQWTLLTTDIKDLNFYLNI